MKSEARRQRAIHRVRVVVKTACNKMSAAPELNPGDWKWIEFISPYIDGCRHSGDNDREGWWGGLRISQQVQREWRKGAPGREKKGQWCVTSCPLELFNNTPLPLYHYGDQGFLSPVGHDALAQRQASAGSPTKSLSRNGHNWTSWTNSWMTGVKRHRFPRG